LVHMGDLKGSNFVEQSNYCMIGGNVIQFRCDHKYTMESQLESGGGGRDLVNYVIVVIVCVRFDFSETSIKIGI